MASVVQRAATPYDRIGTAYNRTRKPDPAHEHAILRALGDARRVLNVGAGTGSYEPADRWVVAVEPSQLMISQRPDEAAPVVQARAEHLPFNDTSFDAALAILTVHHWEDPVRGLREMRRVAATRVVVLTADIDVWADMWLVRDYLPEIAQLDRDRFLPPEAIAAELGGGRILPVPISSNCTDGFTPAFWRRPYAYLNQNTRTGMSSFAYLDDELVKQRLARLAADLESGRWHERNHDLLDLDEYDAGHRLVLAGV
jgi:SAM-dependent methyltransferase